jgi:hypothetical protein
MDDDAVRAANPSWRGDLDHGRLLRDQAPPPRRRAMAEDGIASGVQERANQMPLDGDESMTEGVNRVMNDVQALSPEPPASGAARHAASS